VAQEKLLPSTYNAFRSPVAGTKQTNSVQFCQLLDNRMAENLVTDWNLCSCVTVVYADEQPNGQSTPDQAHRAPSVV